jgi:glycosyltransferase involved in cell wall biosynthesis
MNNGKRPAILIFVRYYLPGYKSGGPVRTISNMVEALGGEFDFRIVALDRDVAEPEPYPHLAGEGQWLQVGKARVLYLSPSQQGLRSIGRIICETQHDVLYLNSFFDPVFTIKPLIACRLGLVAKTRCLVAPRGEFSPNALKLKSVKKKVFLQFARASGLYRGLERQASSEREAGDIRRVLGERHIKVAMNLPDSTASAELPPFEPRKPGEPLRVVFLSRISPMKNLDYALEVLRQVQVPVRFNIYGAVEDEVYWKRCREIMATLPDNIEAAYQGSVPHAQVAETLARHDVFFLPTRGENYGHVIFEALSAGTPVLIADTTPWKDLAAVGIGWELPLENPAAFAGCIGRMFALNVEECEQGRRLAVAFARRWREKGSSVAQTRSLFAPCRPDAAKF